MDSKQEKAMMEGLDILDKIETDTRVLHKTCLCNNQIDILENSKRFYSGIVNFSECLCDGCRKEIAGQCKIVCLKCKNLQGYIKPGKHSTGFPLIKDACYHIETCPKCVPDNFATPILEIDRWCADQGIPTKKNLDILEECEKKAGQGAKDASVLKASLIKGT